MLLPVFSDDAVPGRIRLFISFGIVFALFGLLGGLVPTEASGGYPSAFAGLLITEFATGLALGALVRIMFYAAAMAGSIISFQVGLSAAFIMDPAQGGQAPLLSRFVMVSAAVFAFALEVHHLWIASIVQSYAAFPVGTVPDAAGWAELAALAVQRAFVLAVGLAAPLLAYGILFNVALGLASRLAPAIQVFFIGQPLNIMAGLAIFAITVGIMLTSFANAMADWMIFLWGSNG